MNKAFIETTVLTDALLKTDFKRDAARAAIGRYSETLLPVYAIKEFKAGPLHKFVWLHNKFLQTRSFADTIAAIQAMMAYKKYWPSTALEALRSAAAANAPNVPADLARQFGEDAQQDRFLADQYRLSLKALILSAWKQRRSLATDTVDELACYTEAAPYEDRSGLLFVKPTDCRANQKCSIAALLRKQLDQVRAVLSAIPENSKKENQRRAKALRQVLKEHRHFSEQDCRDLGDAVFVLCAPEGFLILTTNTSDHKALAQAIGKDAVAP